MKLKEFLEKYKLQVIALVVLLVGLAWLRGPGCDVTTAGIFGSSDTSIPATTNVDNATNSEPNVIPTEPTVDPETDNKSVGPTDGFNSDNAIDEPATKVPATDGAPSTKKTSADRVECPEDKRTNTLPAGYPTDSLDNFGC